jgi:dienelactone hydrolase
MATRSFAPYPGKDEYLFVSYSHEDEESAYAELDLIHSLGFNVWFDEGIGPGHYWPKELAERIEHCRLVVFLVTPGALKSENCAREINFALENQKPLIAIHLTELELPSDWRFILGDRQAVLKHRWSEEAYRERLAAAIREHMLPPAEDETSPAEPVEPAGAPAVAKPKRSRRPLLFVAAAAVLIALSVPLYQNFSTSRENADWVNEEGMPQIDALLEMDRPGDAFRAVEAVEAHGGSAQVTEALRKQTSVVVDLNTEPEGANAYYRLYTEPADQWVSLGQTPLNDQRLPRDLLVLRFEKEGYDPAIRVTHAPGIFSRNAAYAMDMGQQLDPLGLTLPAIQLTQSHASDDMVAIPTTDYPLQFSGMDILSPILLPGFQIDRYEVTNQAYQAFVDGGGYQNPTYWQDLGLGDEWQSTVAGFTDNTGKPGPSNWEFGRYPQGRGNYPVTGVSWYEAMAFAKFKGKSLPSVYHWLRATVMMLEGLEPVSPGLIAQSNFSGEIAPVDAYPGVSAFGAFGTAGNAREWAYNSVGDSGQRAIMGGSHSEPPYVFHNWVRADPLDRTETNGLRLARFGDAQIAELLEPIPYQQLDRSFDPPIADDQTFESFVQLYQYARTPLTAHVESEVTEPLFTRQKVLLKPGVGSEFLVYIWLPETAEPPYDALLYMGGYGGFRTKHNMETNFPWQESEFFDMLLRSGRAVVWPVWYGSYQRWVNVEGLPQEMIPQAALEQHREWNRDAGLTLDYLQSRKDFTGNVAYLGVSFGASLNWKTLYFQPRVAAAVQLVGGLPILPPGYLPSSAHSIHYLPRITMPVLMLNGTADTLVPVEYAETAMKLLGTPEDEKRLVLYPSGHWPLPRNQMRREILQFLDEHLGTTR